MGVQHAATVRFLETIDVSVLYQGEVYPLRVAKGQCVSGVLRAFQLGGIEMFDLMEASGRTFTNVPYAVVTFLE